MANDLLYVLVNKPNDHKDYSTTTRWYLIFCDFMYSSYGVNCSSILNSSPKGRLLASIYAATLTAISYLFISVTEMDLLATPMTDLS